MTSVPTRAAVLAALDQVPDPCAFAAGFDLSVIDLGLVYDVAVDNGEVEIAITFTELGCQFTHRIVTEVTEAVRALGWDGPLHVRPCWDPPWSPDRMSSRAATVLAEARRGYPTGPVPLTLSVPTTKPTDGP